MNLRQEKMQASDRSFRGLTMLCATVALILLGWMVFEMMSTSLPAIREFGWRFLTSSRWNPVTDNFGALPYIFGTVVSSLLALLLAAPLGLGTAIFLAELAPAWLRLPASFLVELLAAIPSIVYGIWGLFVLAPLMAQRVEPLLGERLGLAALPLFAPPYYGVGLLTAGIILAIMIVPTIAAVSRDVIASVPVTQREALLALGATRWETIWKAVLPFGRSGLVGAMILGLGRALGETMAVIMVIGNQPKVNLSLFAPAHSMASVIANEFSEAVTPLHTAALIEIGLLLFLITLLLNIVARCLVGRVERQAGSGGRL